VEWWQDGCDGCQQLTSVFGEKLMKRGGSFGGTAHLVRWCRAGLVAHGAATVSTISVGATRGHGLLDDNLGVKPLV
jgi:hypothetical protein